MNSSNPIKQVMKEAISQAQETMNENIGGPFGAAIIDLDGNIIALSSNSVLSDHDPTAHAEINAIRMAGKKLKTHDLSGCILVTTAYPCPMCMSAIIWANIKKVIYGCRPCDAEAIGFRDDFLYRFMKSPENHPDILILEEQYREDCLVLFEEYQRKNKTIY
jgi:guanine deaminase